MKEVKELKELFKGKGLEIFEEKNVFIAEDDLISFAIVEKDDGLITFEAVLKSEPSYFVKLTVSENLVPLVCDAFTKELKKFLEV